jgi:hypothetical protein
VDSRSDKQRDVQIVSFSNFAEFRRIFSKLASLKRTVELRRLCAGSLMVVPANSPDRRYAESRSFNSIPLRFSCHPPLCHINGSHIGRNP